MFRGLLLGFLVIMSAPAFAKSKAGVTMPDTLNVEGKKLVLNGLGIREATVFNVDVYVAGLYVEAPSRDAAAIIDGAGAKKLVMHFVRDVDKSDLTKAWSKGFENNGGKKLASKVKQLNSYMDAMEEGQRLAFTYVPDKGLAVSVKGKTKGTIAGDDFAKVFWKIFVGPNPPNSGLKSGLLGG